MKLVSRNKILVVLTAGLLVLIAASTAAAQPFSRSFAWAPIVDANGESIGTAALTQKKEKVHIYAWATGLTPGKHGIHVHAVGQCDPTAFVTAGSHFNPEIRKHGLHNPEGPHAGDMPNMEVREIGFGIMRAATDRISLSDGPKSVFDADGSAIIIHAAEDDQVTDPTGNSGARIACGVIERVQ
jgi:Cu-Zn family superoxide dismutase